jgi:hypothetical protein
VIFCRCSKEAEPGSDMCFRCRVSSVGFTFRGGGQMYGRHNFAERTNAEYLAEHVGDVKQGLKDGTIAPLKDFTS